MALLANQIVVTVINDLITIVLIFVNVLLLLVVVVVVVVVVVIVVVVVVVIFFIIVIIVIVLILLLYGQATIPSSGFPYSTPCFLGGRDHHFLLLLNISPCLSISHPQFSRWLFSFFLLLTCHGALLLRCCASTHVCFLVVRVVDYFLFRHRPVCPLLFACPSRIVRTSSHLSPIFHA